MREMIQPPTMDDILRDPNKFGAPTFEQFRAWKNKQRDQQMVALSEGPQNFRKDLKRIRYFCHGKELGSEEAVEKMLADHGFTLQDIDLEGKSNRLARRINYVGVGGGLDHEIWVDFLP